MTDTKRKWGCLGGTILSIILTIISMIFSPMIAGFLCNGHKNIIIQGTINPQRDDIDFKKFEILVQGQVSTNVNEDGIFSFTFKTVFPSGLFVYGCNSCETSSIIKFVVIENKDKTIKQEYTYPVDKEAFENGDTFKITLDFPITQ